jgi:hypothetical protein
MKEAANWGGLTGFAFVSEPGQRGLAQAKRIAFAPVGGCNNARRDGLVNRLSRAFDLLACRVKGFAHDARHLIVEATVMRSNERQNGRHVLLITQRVTKAKR